MAERISRPHDEPDREHGTEESPVRGEEEQAALRRRSAGLVRKPGHYAAGADGTQDVAEPAEPPQHGGPKSRR